ncbi:unnamed protein product, partial [Mesorhabditis belari]|uniref:Uncharacterized protein n=1 Tax=Mesorhabditis belari TaxID=2138241 RepID=A0AAF3EP03_9BILA
MQTPKRDPEDWAGALGKCWNLCLLMMLMKILSQLAQAIRFYMALDTGGSANIKLRRGRIKKMRSKLRYYYYFMILFATLAIFCVLLVLVGEQMSAHEDVGQLEDVHVSGRDLPPQSDDHQP